MERLDRNQFQQPEEQNRLQSETIADIYRPPAPRTDDREGSPGADRPRNRDERREQRRERLHNFIERLRDGGGLDRLLDRIGQPAEVRERLRMFVDFISDVKGIKIGREDGKLRIDIERNKASRVENINQKQGPVTINSVDLADRISFRIGRGQNGVRLDAIEGIGVNGKFELGPVKKDFKVNLRTAELDKKDEKPTLKVEIATPEAPSIKVPITIPLEHKK